MPIATRFANLTGSRYLLSFPVPLNQIVRRDIAQPRAVSRGVCDEILAGCLVDPVLGELRERVVRVSLFVERLLQDARRDIVAERLRIAAAHPYDANS